MNYHKFNYVTCKKTNPSYSPLQRPAPSATTDSDSAPLLSSLGRYPIRVTPSAVSSLLYTILCVIEFHAPVAPHPVPHERSLRRGQSSSNVPSSGFASVLPAATAVFGAVSSFFGKSGNVGKSKNTMYVQSVSQPAPVSNIAQPDEVTNEEKLAVLKRLYEQPFVVPVTQVIHKLGDIHIVICETHNPTVMPAYQRALKEIAAIVEQTRREKLEGCSQSQSKETRISSPACSSSGNRISTRSSLIATIKDLGSGLRGCESALRGPPDVQEGSRCVGFYTQGIKSVNDSSSQIFVSPTGRREDQYSPAHSAPCWSERTSKAVPWAFQLQADEIALEISVRLSVNEVRWHVPHTRPLAEWSFIVIQTNDEDTVIRTGQSPTLECNDWEGNGSAGGVHRQVTSSGGGLMFINDPSQVEDVIQFISKTFYDAINMETFSNFTTGELVFDVQTRRCFSFT